MAKDVAEPLRYANTKEAVNEHCHGVVKHHPIVYSLGRQQRVSIISEKDIYRLIFRSRLPEAEADKKGRTAGTPRTLRERNSDPWRWQTAKNVKSYVRGLQAAPGGLLVRPGGF